MMLSKLFLSQNPIEAKLTKTGHTRWWRRWCGANKKLRSKLFENIFSHKTKFKQNWLKLGAHSDGGDEVEPIWCCYQNSFKVFITKHNSCKTDTHGWRTHRVWWGQNSAAYMWFRRQGVRCRQHSAAAIKTLRYLLYVMICLLKDGSCKKLLLCITVVG